VRRLIPPDERRKSGSPEVGNRESKQRRRCDIGLAGLGGQGVGREFIYKGRVGLVRGRASAIEEREAAERIVAVRQPGL